MKLTLLSENLGKGLGIASRFIASRPQLPILTNLLLKTEKGRLRIGATNLDVGANLWLAAKVEEEGEITVPAKLITEMVASLPAGRVDLFLKDGQLELKTESVQATFNGVAASEFPKMPSKGDLESTFSLKREDLIRAVAQVGFAAATDDSRPVLTGVDFVFGKSEVRMVATDGYRLSFKSLGEEGKEKGMELIIPAQTLKEVAHVATSVTEEDVSLVLMEEANQVIFSLGEVEVISRLVEGKFPEWEKIVPEKTETKVSIDKEELDRAVRMAAIFARESANIVRLKTGKDKLEVAANKSEVGKNKSVLEGKITGPGGEIAFNYRYLLDFLANVEGERVVLEMSGALAPGVFRGEEDKSFFHIVMPVKVQE